ncbi:MAG: Gfo/Idh/MocA family oxidoreductase [Candidatus Nanopelagicales bacterium]|nr:Gfo/Idh/MocA family oxidoreductase [Candidatus Nanopelagicales bacterium]
MNIPTDSAVTPIRVGLLAYGAIGHEHNLAVQATDGLVLTAVCDTNPERIAAALELAPQAQTFSDATEMLDSGLLDLVVISTPPNSHAEWARAALSRGIHVVVEKPMALLASEGDELMELAAEQNLTLIVYQNRRFDRDFVTMRRLIYEGAIGTPFAFESFVGGYSRPCDYWHSMVDVSGGAIFDWGSHYLDQVLNLFPQPVDYVTGHNHKRHWHHVTNADHAEVTLTFADGVTASFIHSDLAAARKPKYYVLGTEGAIVAHWNLIAEPAVADLPALVTVHSNTGEVVRVDLDETPDFTFHRELAQFLHSGTPMQVTTVASRDVVAIMEAAERSAANNGRPEVPTLRGREQTSVTQ